MIEVFGKTCSRCHERKPLQAFGNVHGAPRSACKTCEAKARREYAQAHPDLVKAKNRRSYWNNREANLARSRRRNQEHRASVRLVEDRSNRLVNWPTALLKGARQRSKVSGYAFDLTVDFIREKLEAQNGRCYWLGLKLTPSIEKRNPLQPSLDRLDCSKGYTQDNVVLSCQFANMGRSEMEPERFAAFVETLKAHFQSSIESPISFESGRVTLRVA